MRRPALNEIDLDDAMNVLLGNSGKKGAAVMTMARGQWDALLNAAYQSGWTLLEVDDNERPVKAYRRAAS